MVNEQQNKMERLASNGGPFFISTFKNILEKIKQLLEKEICCRSKKSKEVVENWNQRILDIKVLISIVNFGKGSN